jgi:23S rRNA pseudouridine1911/1915/1917 synthase
VAKQFRFQVSSDQSGLRLDQGINAALPEISRTLARKLIAQGGVYLERKRVKVASRIVRQGQAVEVHLMEEIRKMTEATNSEHPVVIVERGEGYLVVDKASGIFSAPTKQTDRGDLLEHLRLTLQTQDEAVPPLHLVHRLDRPTSGLMLIATSKNAAAHLSEQLASGTMKRLYRAILVGALSEKTTVNTPIDEKAAETTFTPLEECGGLTLVEAELKTGRTHQVRIHADSLNRPVAGDSKYGRRVQRDLDPRPPRLALHACQLIFIPPSGGAAVVLKSEFPRELSEWFTQASASKAGVRQDDC